jgi:hypothetical protein
VSGEHAFVVLVIVAGVVITVGIICVAIVEVARAKHGHPAEQDDGTETRPAETP